VDFHHVEMGGRQLDQSAQAIAIAWVQDYDAVVAELRLASESYVRQHDDKTAYWLRDYGIPKGLTTPHQVWKPYLLAHGWFWTPKAEIGSGATVHLKDGEIPPLGTYVVQCSQHPVCIKDGAVYAYYDPRRGGHRMVYGWFSLNKPADQTLTTCAVCGTEWFTMENLTWHRKDAHS
jgi:hypothetical protein